MTKPPIIDDPLIQEIRAIKHRLAAESGFDVHKMAEAVRRKRSKLAASFGLLIPSPEPANQAVNGPQPNRAPTAAAPEPSQSEM